MEEGREMRWMDGSKGRDGEREGDEMYGWMQGKKGRKGRSERGRKGWREMATESGTTGWPQDMQCLRSLMMRV
jgi:hypothetical protein